MKIALIAASILLATTGLAAAKSPPKLSIGGTWHCVQFCMPFYTGGPTTIMQSGRNLVFVNETGVVSRGFHSGGGKIRLFDWAENAHVSRSMRMIAFENGAAWTR